jgi:hypothetical protein
MADPEISSVAEIASDREIQPPPDYRRWRLWEVGAPLGIPVCVFIWLLIVFSIGSSQPPKHASDALIAITGAGDFLIFGALLALNVYGTIDLEANKHAFVKQGEDFGKNRILIVSGVLLFFYAVVRVSVHTSQDFSTKDAQFGVAIASTIVLLVVLLWIDNVIWNLHLAKMKILIRGSHLNAQYNVF